MSELRNLLVSKAKAGGSTPRLPEEYQEVEYLESTGTQIIDTGIKGELSLLEVEMYAEMTVRNYSYQFMAGFNSGAQIGTQYEGVWSCEQTLSNITAYKKTHLEMYWDDKFHIIIDDASVITRTVSGARDDFRSNNYYLFTGRINNQNYYQCAGCRIYLCKMTYNGVLVRDFVPCYRKVDGIAGLYDLANGVFYTNAGTGIFVVGKNVN